jgi:cell wall assembly regulator SMI1
MSLTALIDDYIEALREAGVTTPFADWAQFDAATDVELAELSAEIGSALPDDLKVWMRHVTCAFPLAGGYDAVAAKSILDRTQGTKTIDFSQHFSNISSWKDGRFDDGRMAKTYWQPEWVGFARDGCGNEYCSDLAPGPKGKIGQILAMEFQDGQGPYLAQWPTLEAMLRDHLNRLATGAFTVDEEGFIAFE